MYFLKTELRDNYLIKQIGVYLWCNSLKKKKHNTRELKMSM